MGIGMLHFVEGRAELHPALVQACSHAESCSVMHGSCPSGIHYSQRGRFDLRYLHFANAEAYHASGHLVCFMLDALSVTYR